MPRTPTAPPTAEPGPNSIVASAANVSSIPVGSRSSVAKTAEWQNAAWDFYDLVGELRYAANWTGSAMSRVRLKVQRHTDKGPEDVKDGPAVEVLDALFGGETGQSQMLGTFGIQATIAGESFLVGEQGDDGDEWSILSSSELQRGRGGKWTVDRGEGTRRPLDDKAMVVRLWRPHPRRYLEADSPVRAVLPILRELESLTKKVAADIDSRLAGAGILALPSEMTFASPADGQPADGTGDPFFDAFTQSLVAPLGDRSNPASVVPIVVRAPGAVLGSIQHISFSTPLDSQAQSLREEAIRRLAAGMDLPPEVVLGQGDSNHWSAWQIEESTLKVHIEPLCELLSDGLTSQYLKPGLEAMGSWDDDLFITADTSDLRMRPDHTDSAIALYNLGELSGESLRRETGFDEGDKPKPKELERILYLKLLLAGGELAGPAAKALKLELDTAPPGAPPVQVTIPVGRATPAVGDGADPEVTPDPRTQRGLPRAPEAAALVAACEVLALRAMERASNRLTNRGRTTRAHAIDDVEAALAREWEQVPRVASLTGLDPVLLRNTLHAYAVDRLTSGEQHDPSVLFAALTRG